jgi:hypothetical protein
MNMRDDIGFLFNVRARINIAQLTESKAIGDVGSLFDGEEEKVTDNLYKVARILNHEYELKKRRDQGKEVDLTENYSIIKKDDIIEMDNFEYNEFAARVFRTLRGERTVEATPKKGKAKPSK